MLALAIDLDGTLLQSNTFRDYLSFCGGAALRRGRLDLCMAIAWWVTLRKLRLVSHSRMKNALLRRTAPFMQRRDRLDCFVEAELTKVDTEVQRLMETYRNRGYLLVMATAAPSLYAVTLAEMLHLDACVSTPLPQEVVLGQWHECVGQHKVERLLRLLRTHQAQLDVVITDHHDDLALLQQPEVSRRIVVNPSPLTLRRLDGLDVEVLRTTPLYH